MSEQETLSERLTDEQIAAWTDYLTDRNPANRTQMEYDMRALLSEVQEARQREKQRAFVHEAGCPMIADDESDEVLADYGHCACKDTPF